MRAAAALVLAACGSIYEPGSFIAPALHREFRGARVAFGCVDVAVTHDRRDASRAIVEYWFGNGCDRRAKIDLSAPRVVAKTWSGERELVARDRFHRLRAYAIGARTAGAIAIEYDDPHGAASEVIEVCVDVRGLVPGTEAPRAARSICSSETTR